MWADSAVLLCTWFFHGKPATQAWSCQVRCYYQCCPWTRGALAAASRMGRDLQGRNKYELTSSFAGPQTSLRWRTWAHNCQVKVESTQVWHLAQQLRGQTTKQQSKTKFLLAIQVFTKLVCRSGSGSINLDEADIPAEGCQLFLRLPNGQYGPVSQLSWSEKCCTGPFNWSEAHCASEVKRRTGPFLRKSLKNQTRTTTQQKGRSPPRQSGTPRPGSQVHGPKTATKAHKRLYRQI